MSIITNCKIFFWGFNDGQKTKRKVAFYFLGFNNGYKMRKKGYKFSFLGFDESKIKEEEIASFFL